MSEFEKQKFEIEEDGIEKVMFINPAQEATLLKDDDFLSTDKFTSGVAVNGAIGKIAGCWIKKSKKVKLIQYEKAEDGTITIVATSSTDETRSGSFTFLYILPLLQRTAQNPLQLRNFQQFSRIARQSLGWVIK